MAVVSDKALSASVTEDDAAVLGRVDRMYRALAADYPELRLEQTAEGEVVVMPPSGFDTGHQNANLTADLVLWNRRNKGGRVLDSNTCFVLPNGAKRAPDAAWVEQSRVDALSAEQRTGFAPLCPDFVIELLSPTDRLVKTQEKMREYLDNGLRLGWLLNPRTKTVEVYRPGREVEVLDDPATVSGEGVLPGFVLELAEIWA